MGLADGLDQQALVGFAGHDRRTGLAAFPHGSAESSRSPPICESVWQA